MQVRCSEIRNHRRKDACLLEDKTRSRNPILVGALAMLRSTLLFMRKEQEEHTTLPGFVEAIAAANVSCSAGRGAGRRRLRARTLWSRAE